MLSAFDSVFRYLYNKEIREPTETLFYHSHSNYPPAPHTFHVATCILLILFYWRTSFHSWSWLLFIVKTISRLPYFALKTCRMFSCNQKHVEIPILYDLIQIPRDSKNLFNHPLSPKLWVTHLPLQARQTAHSFLFLGTMAWYTVHFRPSYIILAFGNGDSWRLSDPCALKEIEKMCIPFMKEL